MQTKLSPSVDANELQASVSVADYDVVLNRALSALSAKAYIEPSSLDQLKQARQYLFSTIDTCLSCGLTQSGNSMWSGWGWQSIIAKPDLRIGLMELHRDKSIPIHDHPEGCGILVVLKGRLAISTYQASNNKKMEKSVLVVLSKKERQILKEKEFALITETEGNIHSLASMDDICIVLDILLKPYDENQRSWYMPTSEQTAEKGPFVCFSVNNSHFMNKG